MSDSQSKIELNELLAHTDWVRRIACGLVGNSARADDLVQDTWLDAIRKPPRARGNLRAWLAQAVTNRARQSGRGESRRQRREHLAARSEAVPSMEELADKAARHREVVDLVLELDEPFRSVVLLRFFEGMRPPEIADRLDVPLKTVHSRLQRAFDKLRDRLDGEYGDRSRWCLALAPLVRGFDLTPAAGTGSLLTLAGVWIVNVNLKVALVLFVAIVGSLGLWRLFDAGPDLEAGESLDLTAEPEAPWLDRESASELATVDSRNPSSIRRAVAAPSAIGEEAAGIEHAEFVTVRGRALGVKGEALEGVAIGHDEPLATTGAGGAFEFEVALPAKGCLRVLDEGRITLRQSCLKDNNLEKEHIVVAAPVTDLEGWIEEGSGVPVAEAQVTLSAQGDTFYGFTHALDMTSFVTQRSESELSGHFAFARFPDAPGLRLYVTAAGFQPRTVDLDQSDWPLVVQLVREGDSEGVHIGGLVLDEYGSPVEGAEVRLGEAKTKTDATGAFRLAASYFDADTPLCAGKRGHRAALVPNYGARLESEAGSPRPVELVLGGPPLEIRGRVLDDSGAPCVGWSVSTVRETAISQYRIPETTAEGLARDGDRTVRTDAEGGFRLSGLFPREYLVHAYDDSTLLRTEATLRAGDEDALLRVDRAFHELVRGRVVDRRGEPLADVSVRLSLDTVLSDIGSSNISRESVVTDETGAFTFESVPKAHVYLRYSGEEVIPGTHRLLDREPQDEVVIEAIQRCHFRIELADPSSGANLARFNDANGDSLQVNRFEANGMSGFPWAMLDEGKSEVLSVSELAVEVILMDGDRELSRQPVTLETDGVTVLSL